MIGLPMKVTKDGFGVSLRPITKDDINHLAVGFNSMTVHMNTLQMFAQSYENELDWYERIRKDDKSVYWAIQPDGAQQLVGVTDIHGISISGNCATGIVIFNQSWWGKGVATRAHLARTMFAADFLGRNTISSSARVTNPGSCKALERVGYALTGRSLRTDQRRGEFLDTNQYTWLHPEREALLYPDTGWPEEIKPAIERAHAALQLAREVVTFP